MFLVQFMKNQSQDVRVLSTSLSAIFLLKSNRKKVRVTRFETPTRAIHDLSKLLRLKTV